ncbi:response regulator transcription factor [Schumannella sp. 10F1B-5-1]|uniref:response regulator transcription factor n=1 Tax=Schumannella sp. 10F1B-5-1 TaxID=2590780 RepID=UPI0011302A94|nr:response regulator transcription factor [Schumannella sp. 10F1B-5-1]TPW73011.1 response regulator transcription factor [Schumannella sp. 10F1B-5-1]
MARILIADDEARIAAFVSKGLQAAGHTAETVSDGHAALARAESGDVDLLLLDVGLPGINGFEVLRHLRGSGSQVPVIMLTARASLLDTIAGFDGGADDYITKPFRFDELLVRVRARLRTAGTPTRDEGLELAVAGVRLDLRTRRAQIGDARVDLSGREFALLEEFLRHPDQVLSREQLLSRVWGIDFDPGSNVVDAYVRSLRKKIGAERISTVRGAGYRLVGETD